MNRRAKRVGKWVARRGLRWLFENPTWFGTIVDDVLDKHPRVRESIRRNGPQIRAVLRKIEEAAGD